MRFCYSLWPDQCLISSVYDFVIKHAKRDLIMISRGDDGRIRGVMFGWPVNALDSEYDGKYVDYPKGTCFYCNMLIIDPGYHGTAEFNDISDALKEQVLHDYPNVTHYGYHREKHGNRYRIKPLGRL